MKYKIVTKFIKDISFEIPDIKTFLDIENNISKYELKIDISSIALKKDMMQVDTTLKLAASPELNKRMQVEITLATIIKIIEKNENKEELQKIILVDVPNEIYPNLYKIFSGIVKSSGIPDLSIKETIDFQKLFEARLS